MNRLRGAANTVNAANKLKKNVIQKEKPMPADTANEAEDGPAQEKLPLADQEKETTNYPTAQR